MEENNGVMSFRIVVSVGHQSHGPFPVNILMLRLGRGRGRGKKTDRSLERNTNKTGKGKEKTITEVPQRKSSCEVIRRSLVQRRCRVGVALKRQIRRIASLILCFSYFQPGLEVRWRSGTTLQKPKLAQGEA